jgi:hypothetical protein
MHDISLLKLFSYPLGPIPWALATADGSMVKTSKAQLLHHLESLAVSDAPPVNNDTHIIDGNAMLQACVRLPDTFEDFASQIFGYLPKCTSVHFVTDSYKSNSIKQFERSRRGQSSTHIVGGQKIKMPHDFKSFMHNDENKKRLIRFILNEWSSDKYARRMQGRSVFSLTRRSASVSVAVMEST